MKGPSFGKVILVIISLVLAWSLAACGLVKGSPATAGQIAFVSNRDGNEEIYVMNADGSNPVNLTKNPAGDIDPAWSPDAKKIAFQSNNRDGNWIEIYVMNADGSNPVNLTRSPSPASEGGPAWSPDGKKIAFQCGTEYGAAYRGTICVMNADGSDPVNLTHNPAWDESPAWSPAK